ncbi:hypothetical protein CEQ90_16465 [Lewinellaceae bacterium SD302]|nr:hypothetical protein CEQ90_16465 [Lewinellaceae bacterium SD302]
MITQSVNIFLLEDSKADAALVKRAVLKFMPNAIFTHAASETEFLEKISWMNYDIVLADYHIPGYNGLEALLYVKAHYPELPFIFVTGALDNEVEAAQVILKGANGYVLKGNLKELDVQISEALEKASENREQQIIRQQQDNARKLMLQEAYEMLKGSPEFGTKERIIYLLKEAGGLKGEEYVGGSQSEG